MEWLGKSTFQSQLPSPLFERTAPQFLCPPLAIGILGSNPAKHWSAIALGAENEPRAEKNLPSTEAKLLSQGNGKSGTVDTPACQRNPDKSVQLS